MASRGTPSKSPVKASHAPPQEHPLPLITLNANNKFEVGAQAMDMISKLDGDVAIITVAGLYRYVEDLFLTLE